MPHETWTWQEMWQGILWACTVEPVIANGVHIANFNWLPIGTRGGSGKRIYKILNMPHVWLVDIYEPSQLSDVSVDYTHMPREFVCIYISVCVCFSKLITSLKRSTHGMLAVCLAGSGSAFTLILFTQKNILWKLENSFCLPSSDQAQAQAWVEPTSKSHCY